MEVVLQLRLWSSFSSCMIRRCSYFGGLYGESHVCCLVNAANASCLPDILIFEGILNLCRTVESWLSQPCLQGEKPPHPLLQSLGSSFFHWLDFSWVFHSSGGFFSFSFFNKYCIFCQSLYCWRLSASPGTSTSPPPRFKHGFASITTRLPWKMLQCLFGQISLWCGSIQQFLRKSVFSPFLLLTLVHPWQVLWLLLTFVKLLPSG